MEWQWGKRDNARVYKQSVFAHTTSYTANAYWLSAWAALLLCYLPVTGTIHRFWLEAGRTRNEVCELSYGKQKGYYWQIEKACLLSSLFLPAFIFNTSLCTETGLLETNRHFGDRGTRPHLISLSLLETSSTWVAGRITYCWKVFGLVFIAVDTPKCSPTFGAECVYLERESAANWVAVAGLDSSSAAARRHRLPTAIELCSGAADVQTDGKVDKRAFEM